MQDHPDRTQVAVSILGFGCNLLFLPPLLRTLSLCVFPRRQPWYKELRQLAKGRPKPLTVTKDLLTQPRTGRPHHAPTVFYLHGWLIERHNSKTRASQWLSLLG